MLLPFSSTGSQAADAEMQISVKILTGLSSSRSSPATSLTMSKLKSKTRRATGLISSIWFPQANSWRMTALCQITISRKSLPGSWCFVCKPASLSLPFANSLRNTAATRWSAASIVLAYSPTLPTATGSVATPTTCTARRRSKRRLHQLLLCLQNGLLSKPHGPETSTDFLFCWLGKKVNILHIFRIPVY